MSFSIGEITRWQYTLLASFCISFFRSLDFLSRQSTMVSETLDLAFFHLMLGESVATLDKALYLGSDLR